ncbi:hypothetical protein L484_016573 [Morus notabilis]|uniref:Uncharacterized protein n=1 Tax=Morus notabilis TaxID=981085 RepID=W9QKF1_9ROSA|nr:hypothetical protein L484_016573 [Morus notabilis]
MRGGGYNEGPTLYPIFSCEKWENYHISDPMRSGWPSREAEVMSGKEQKSHVLIEAERTGVRDVGRTVVPSREWLLEKDSL